MPELVADQLVTRRGVELVKVGEWPAVTGPASITIEKLESMVRASQSEWWSGASMHRGHFDPRYDGEPALGWLSNLNVVQKANGDISLYGDIEKVPSKFAPRLEDAFRNRSIEWIEDVVAPDGTTWPAVLTGLAVLGAAPPGVDGLEPIAHHDTLELFAAAREHPEKYVRTAFVGEHGSKIVGALAQLQETINPQSDESDQIIDRSGESQEDQNMSDTLDARLREMLNASAEDDIEALVKELKERSTTASVVEPGTPDPEPNEGEDGQPASPEAPTPTPASEPSTPENGSDLVSISKERLESLEQMARSGADAARRLQEQDVDRELKQAASRGLVAPAQYDLFRQQMLSGPEGANFVRQMLSTATPVVHTKALGAIDPQDANEEERLNEMHRQAREFLNIKPQGVR